MNFLRGCLLIVAGGVAVIATLPALARDAPATVSVTVDNYIRAGTDN